MPSAGQRPGNAAPSTLARAVLEAVAAGSLGRNLLIELADAVLADEAVKLALAVRAGGPHAVRRAIELAALLLAVGSAAPNSSAQR